MIALAHGSLPNCFHLRTGAVRFEMLRPTVNWPAIRSAYLNDEGSLRVLAERFGVSENTVEKRAARERWRSQLQTLCGKVAEVAEQTAEKRGVEIGERAAAFVERTLNESGEFLDRIQTELDAASRGDPYAVRTLVQAWKDVVATTRTAYGLNETTTGVQRISIYGGQVAIVAITPSAAQDQGS